MLFCAKAKTKGLHPISGVSNAGTVEPEGVDRRPKIAHSGKIRLGGGCRLPLTGAAMEQDRMARPGCGRGE